MNDMVKNLLLWLVIAAVLLSVFNNFNMKSQTEQVGYSDFIQEIQSDQVKRVVVDGLTISGERYDGSNFETVRPMVEDPKLIDDLLEHKVVVEGRKPEQQSVWSQLLVASFPILIIIAVFMFFMRQMQGGAGGRGGPMSFGKSKARLLGEDQITTTFADVAGVDEAKEDVKELVEFLRDPSRFQKLGGRIPRGVLMVGQPGTGKTLLAKAIAGEAKVPFFTISGSDFVEMFVGVGASRVRDMFDQAKKQSPCIIFIDEIDAVGRHRGAGLGGGHDEREQTLNQLLVEMDGFEVNDGVIVIAATNRPDVLDPALLRPGRFDRQVVVGLPDIRGREQILKVHMRKVPLSEDVEASKIARGTPGFSGADLANLVNEAALFAARANVRTVGMAQFEMAKDKIMMGAERKSMVMSEDEKRNTAYHEAGHALVAISVPSSHPVHKATIIPRGRALGMVMQLPERDQISMSYEEMTSRLAVMMAGRVAEELTFGKKNVTSGAQSDIEQATRLARAMVTQWGYSDKLGKVSYGENQQEVFLGHSVAQTKNVSEETAQIIDEEVRRLVDEGFAWAKKILTKRKKDLEVLAQGLLEYETLTGSEIDGLMDGKPPARDMGDDTPPTRGSAVPKSGAKSPKGKKGGATGGMKPQPS